VTSATPRSGGIDTSSSESGTPRHSIELATIIPEPFRSLRGNARYGLVSGSDPGPLNCASAKTVTRSRWEMGSHAHLALINVLEVRADQSFDRRSVVSRQFQFRAVIEYHGIFAFVLWSKFLDPFGIHEGGAVNSHKSG
jgi:hypothetical protein